MATKKVASKVSKAATAPVSKNGKRAAKSAPAGVDAANYNRALKVDVVDFDDPKRPKSCLEVDFPIGPINVLAQLEINSKKPIYEMGKWWARRQSSVFRSMLIAAAMKAPDDIELADQTVWETYYANHQKAGNFAGINVLDPFMGGGTTLVEGARLGFDVNGVDLNPIAWFVTKTELLDVEPEEVEALFADVEKVVRPQVIPYTTTDCPRGHVGRWYKTDDANCPFDLREARDLGYHLVVQPETFDILEVSESERPLYRYDGPEVIYTFWTKHGPCSRCGHRTPVMRTPIVAVKELTVQAFKATCAKCDIGFDWELDEARMAPAEPLVVAPGEIFITATPEQPTAECPRCSTEVRRPTGRPGRKKVSLTLLVHPRWLKGIPGADVEGELGGWAGSSAGPERRWIDCRSADLALIEVRGELPAVIHDPFDPTNQLDPNRGTAQRVPRQSRESGLVVEKDVDSSFVCGGCGLGQDFLTSVRPTKHTPPAYPMALQGYCPVCDGERRPYNGRFFKVADERDRNRWLSSVIDWESAKSGPLGDLYPTEQLPMAHMTHDLNGGIPNWGYTHWWKLFNPRQLLTHTRLLAAILNVDGRYSKESREAALIALQQYLRNQNMFCFWNPARDTPEPFFSNANYHPKATVIENGCFTDLGRGNWQSSSIGVLEGLVWARKPWEKAKAPASSTAKGVQLSIDDPVNVRNVRKVACASATDLSGFDDQSIDVVVTDPPFGGNVFYADLADFFYVWLREPLSVSYPDYFGASETNKVQEAITNPAEHRDDRTPEQKRLAAKRGEETPADTFYREILTECWRESGRVLKNGGTLAFTFHHNEDQAWVGVLRSLFDAGFVLVATYPIRSDESKGEYASFGSRKIEYDIIHVCRKRLGAPERVSWARMRRWVKDELERLQGLLQHYQKREISDADIRVILRGKALEYYSRHYGQIFTGMDEPLDVAQALIGINEILEEEGMAAIDRPPDTAEPLTGLYLRVFRDRTQIPRDDLHKMLRGTGFGAQRFEDLRWTTEENKVVSIVPIETRFRELRKRSRSEMKTDLDQAHFLVGAAVPGSDVRIRDELNKDTFMLKPSVRDILAWIAERETDKILKDAAERARNIVDAWITEQQTTGKRGQMQLFDL